ncbi:hypothetical protein Mgra_00007785, partial [Meloidogyne graminicola]
DSSTSPTTEFKENKELKTITTTSFIENSSPIAEIIQKPPLQHIPICPEPNEIETNECKEEEENKGSNTIKENTGPAFKGLSKQLRTCFKETPQLPGSQFSFILFRNLQLVSLPETTKNEKILIELFIGSHLKPIDYIWAIEESQKAMKRMFELTGIDYPLNKLTIVSSPLRTGNDAMGGLGLIQIRDSWMEYPKFVHTHSLLVGQIVQQWTTNLLSICDNCIQKGLSMFLELILSSELSEDGIDEYSRRVAEIRRKLLGEFGGTTLRVMVENYIYLTECLELTKCPSIKQISIKDTFDDLCWALLQQKLNPLEEEIPKWKQLFLKLNNKGAVTGDCACCMQTEIEALKSHCRWTWLDKWGPSGQGHTLQAIDSQGVVQTWFRRSYTRHVPLRRDLFAVQQNEEISSQINLDPMNTKIEDLGIHLLARVFQSLPVFSKLQMEHVSRQFRTSSKIGWLTQNKVIVIPEETIKEGTNEYCIGGRFLFRLLMKRCCRYTTELVMYHLNPGDRLFKLLQLAFRLQHLCLDSLYPLSGSELLQIADRLPTLKSLIIKNCRMHYKYARDFQRMLDGLQQLQLLSISDCENFGTFEFNQPLPSSLKIIHLYSPNHNIEKQLTILRTIRQHTPEISALVLGQVNVEGQLEAQLFRNLRVLILPLDEYTLRSRLRENNEFLTPEFVQRLTALDLGQTDYQIGLRIFSQQLPNLQHLALILEYNTNYQLYRLLVQLPSLRSFSFHTKTGWDGLAGRSSTEIFGIFSSLAKKGIIEYLDVDVTLNTKVALDFVNYCPKLKSLFFKRLSRKPDILLNDFNWRMFLRVFDEFKRGKLPLEPSNKLQMLKNNFSNWNEKDFFNMRLKDPIEINHPWIECFNKPTTSHVIAEVCLKELGEGIDLPTEFLKFPPRTKVPDNIENRGN